jgi:hypothetical protein
MELAQRIIHVSRTNLGRLSLRMMLKRAEEGFSSVRSVLYILIILGAVAAGYVSTLWDGIFACQANGYAPDRFVAECSARAYGDYEHGAFWFGLEPTAVDAASRAQVLFLGDSRLQVGFNTAATTNWFAKAATRYYLLGFGWAENVAFVEKLLQKLKPQAKVFVVNVDDFFEKTETPPASLVMRDTGAQTRYEIKRLWQRPHRLICSNIPALCGTSYVVFRSKDTGGYEIHGDHDAKGHWYRSAPVSYVRVVDYEKVASYIASGMDFISRSSVGRKCIIATIIPYPGTKIGTARAVATGLGLNFIAPELDGLQTFDASHLDRTSAERWTAAFYAAAGPQIRKCLDAR